MDFVEDPTRRSYMTGIPFRFFLKGAVVCARYRENIIDLLIE
jgi:hypothetical protein